MALIGKAPELSEYPGNVKHFLVDLNMFFDSNALGDSRRKSLFWNVVGKVDRDKIRNECNLGKDPLDQLYACLERVYSTHSGSEHAASSEEKGEAAFCPESGTAAGDAGFLARDTPALGATARSSRGMEAEGALREKARSPSDLKISKNSQRIPAVASRERSVSPVSAAPSPGAEPMVDDTPVFPADSPPDGGTLSSRPESADSARKLQSQQANEDDVGSEMGSSAASESSSSTTAQPKGIHDSGSSGSPSRSPPAKRRNIRKVVNNIEDDITTATTATVSGRVGRDSQNIKVIADIVNSVLAHGEAEPFAQPVNLDDVPDYKDLVKDLMDFGTIRTRLKDMHYDDVETVLKDVHLVFQNCDDYNHSLTATYQSGLELERYFHKLLKTQLKDFFSRYTIVLV